MGFVLDTPPALEPISLGEAKAHCRIDGSAEDDTITIYIQAARQHIERVTRRSLITQTWVATFCGFPSSRGGFRLPYGPVQSITSVEYYDDLNVQTTLATNLYEASLTEQISEVFPAVDEVWPTYQSRSDAVTIEYDAGYGDLAADVPAEYRQAILLLVGHWFANREAVGTAMTEVPLAVGALLGPLTVQSLA